MLKYKQGSQLKHSNFANKNYCFIYNKFKPVSDQYQLQQSTNIKNEVHLTNMSPDMREEVPVRAT